MLLRRKGVNLSVLILTLITILNLLKIIKGDCNNFEFKCDKSDDDGRPICKSNNDKCDGKSDCPDGSDETWQHCRQNSCPRFAFRCAYGGCITGKRKCDGRVDCHDGSDETDALCNKQTITSLPTATNCGSNQFQCLSSGECFESFYKCDGEKNCADGSDETTELCSAIPCRSFAFTCAYGACVSGKAKCNGVIDCFDGSDETAELCYYKEDLMTTTKRITTSTRRTTTTTSVPPITAKTCDIRLRDRYLILTSLGKPITGSEIAKNTILHYQCSEGFSLFPKERRSGLCTDQGMNEPLPTCVKYCKSEVVVREFSTKATCIPNKNDRSQNYACKEIDDIPPRTVASFECAEYFESDEPYLDNRTCADDGKWDGHRSSCRMKCGTTIDKDFTPTSKNGIKVDSKNIPWHVGIYKNINENRFDYTCSGTILSPILVVTAAHCVDDITLYLNEQESNPKIAERFKIVAGNFHQDFQKDTEIQEKLVQRIKIHEDYDRTTKAVDLALMVLKDHLTFSTKVRPICLKNLQFSAGEIIPNQMGKLSTWGTSIDSATEEVLHVLVGTSLHNADCKNQIQLTDDKFCVETLDQMACRGDSGGGYFVTETTPDRKVQNYLIGVLSTAVLGNRCSIDYLLMTELHPEFRNWIYRFKNEAELMYFKLI